MLVTIGLGFGLKRLDFATGQNSYIDPSSQVAKDNERYQNLFGGESMVVLFTVPEGKTIVDLFTSANITQFGEIEKQMLTNKAVQSVVSPLTLPCLPIATASNALRTAPPSRRDLPPLRAPSRLPAARLTHCAIAL